MDDVKKPRLAATVILLRHGQREPFEIFFTRRPEAMAFLGGMYCFPGGTVRQEDSSPELIERCYGLTPAEARKILGARFAPAQAIGFWVAAIRELFEETGILLGIDPITHNHISDARRDRLLSLADRERTPINFAKALETENLLCDLSRLRYLSHWQTPSGQPIRFDTRFFLAALPERQSPLASSPEVTHSVWLTPDEALERFDKNELPMIFPTFASIRRLADFDSVESVFSSTNSRVSRGPIARA